MKSCLFVLLLAISFKCFPQQKTNWEAAEYISRHIPDSLTQSTDQLASYFKHQCTDESERAAAIYRWVTSNINYSTDSTNQINLGINPTAKITEALRRRKGVCENFAAIFNDISNKSDITSYVVDGYTRQSGIVDKVGHSWCAIKISGSWYLCDPTWDAGFGSNSNYYLIEADEFINTHMPYDPIWQLLSHPVTPREFLAGYSKGTTSDYNFTDSITRYLSMDSLSQLQSSAARIQSFGLYNTLIRNRNNVVKMNIEIIYQDHDTLLYQQAVEYLNTATSIYNSFIVKRNEQFSKAGSIKDMDSSLKVAEEYIADALKKVDLLDRSPATLAINTEAVRSRLQSMDFKLAEQHQFLREYLNSH